MSNIISNRITRRAFVGGMSASLIACAAPRRTWSKTTADVIVIGAGLSGLHAASLIEQAGYKVILLEGNNRIGGRLYTLDNLPGGQDAGGIQIGGSYKRFHAIADRLGVERYVPLPSGRGSLYNVGGVPLTAAQWPEAEQNLLGGDDKATLPDRLFFSYLNALPKLAKVTDWMQPNAWQHDISLRDFLVRQGASAEALRLMEANFNGNSLAEQSALHMIRSLAIFRAGSGPTQYVRGGSQRMTDAMGNALRSEIMLNSEVQVIQDEGDGVELGLANGPKYGARHVICTAPFSVVRQMRVEANLPQELRNVATALPYTNGSFAYISASEAFWKNDGFPETIWSDDPLLGRVFVLGEDPAMIKVWINGASAAQVDRMDDAEVGRAIISKIEQTRPSAKGKLTFLRMFSWQKERFARGMYHHIGTGQGSDLAAAAQYQGERLHFAGEHLSQESSGMEGALETAERAATRVLQQL